MVFIVPSFMCMTNVVYYVRAVVALHMQNEGHIFNQINGFANRIEIDINS